MTPERIAGWVIAGIFVVLFILFMIAVIDRLDDDGDGLRAAWALLDRLAPANIGWCKTC